MTTPKRNGRPPLDPSDPSVSVHFRLPGKQYDATLALARDARLDLGDYIRVALKRANATPPARLSSPE
jgi:hypothetical protein